MLVQHVVAHRQPKFRLLVRTRVRLAAIVRLRARIAIPEPGGNGDETAHALANQGGVGQPIDSLLSGCPNDRVDNWAAQILPLRSLKRRSMVSSGHVPMCACILEGARIPGAVAMTSRPRKT